MRPRIALISDAPGFGGAEIYLANLVEQLSADRDFTAVVGAPGREITSRLSAAGADVVTVAGLARVPRPAPFARLLGALRAARPAAVHVNATDQGDGLAGILAARLLRLPLVVTVHLALTTRSARHERLAGRALRLAGTVIAVSEAVAAHLRRLGVPARVIANGMPVPVPLPDAREQLGAAPGRVLVAGVGRLTEQKGWDVLARAASQVEADVVVVGDGPERPEGLRLLGHHPDAAGLLHAVDVLAAPSRYEGMPLALIEALHAGVPVVGSDIPGIRDVVGDAGILVAPDDPDALAQALNALVADPERRRALGEAGRRRAADRFTVERMARETASAYPPVRMSA